MSHGWLLLFEKLVPHFFGDGFTGWSGRSGGGVDSTGARAGRGWGAGRNLRELHADLDPGPVAEPRSIGPAVTMYMTSVDVPGSWKIVSWVTPAPRSPDTTSGKLIAGSDAVRRAAVANERRWRGVQPGTGRAHVSEELHRRSGGQIIK